MRSRVFLLLVIVLGMANTAYGQIEIYKNWMNVKSETLLDKGLEYSRSGKADSALVCFSMITSRYNGKDESMAKMAAEAYEGLWSVYFLAYSDFSKAFECLKNAQRIYKSLGIERPRLHLNFGGMYQTVAEMCNDKRSDTLSLQYYRDAFQLSLKLKDESTLSTSFANMTNVAYEMDILNSMKQEWADYNSFAFQKEDEYVAYNKLLYLGLVNLKEKKYEEAQEKFLRQLAMMDRSGVHIRYRLQSYLLLADLERCMTNYTGERNWLRKAYDEFSEYDMQDVSIELYKRLSNCYEDLRVSDSALYYRSRYLEAKDGIVDGQILHSFGKMNFLNEINEASQKMAEMKEKEEHQRHMLYLFAGFLVVVSGLLILVYSKNRRLSSSFNYLYEKNVALMSAKEKIELMTRDSQEVALVGVNDKEETTLRRSINDEKLEEMKQKIDKVMRNPEIFCSADFTVEQLASLTGLRYKTVAAVVHSCYNCNFSTLLNRLRVEEASRRIDDNGEYWNYTVEAIAQSVGYKSRNSFSAAFKRETGLYPSEYLRISREKRQ